MMPVVHGGAAVPWVVPLAPVLRPSAAAQLPMPIRLPPAPEVSIAVHAEPTSPNPVSPSSPTVAASEIGFAALAMLRATKQ